MAGEGLIESVIRLLGVGLGIGLLMLVLAGCSTMFRTQPPELPPLLYQPDLLTGARLSGEAPPPDLVPDVSIGLLDSRMKA